MKETFKNLKRVYSYGKECRLNIVLQTVGSIIGMIIGIVLPIFTAKQLVNLTGGLWEQLFWASVCVFIIGVFSAFKTVLIRKNTQVFSAYTNKKIQMTTEKEILKIAVKDIDSNSSGTFIQRIGSDTREMANLFTVGMGYLVGILTDVGIFVAVFILNKTIFIYYVFIALILVLLNLIKSKKYNIKDKEYRKITEKVTGLTGELVRGVRDIKMLNAKESFMQEIDNKIDKQNEGYINMRNVDINYNFVIDLLTVVFEFVLVLFIIFLIMHNYITVSVALVAYSYRGRVMTNFMDRFSSLLSQVKGFNLSCDRVFSLLDDIEFEKEKFGTKHIDKIKGNFEFKDVNFSYDNNNLFHNLSFKVNSLETVAFVGKSGAGKTTIFSLLCKLYNINSGEILIDGYNIDELDEESIRGNITIISQNPYIFNLSIRDNIRLVKEDVTEKEMRNACKMACLDKFIESLPDGYDTVVGEGGVTLSGGQRQRLAIARAFVQKTKIILFDEATSALDNETQKEIQQAINNMKENYTILIIAHRLSTIVNSDRIIFLKDGEIVDEGKHEDLISRNKDYTKLYKAEIVE